MGKSLRSAGSFPAGQFCISMAVALLLAILSCYEIPPMSTFEHVLQDAMVRFRIHYLPSSPIQNTAIVDVDDDTLNAVGQWPWPRYRTASLINALTSLSPTPHEVPPAAIALDILFAEPDRTSLDTIRKSFQKDFGLDISFTGVPPGMDDNDGYLGSSIQSIKAVAAYFMYFHMESKEMDEDLPNALEVTGSRNAISPPVAHGILCNTKSIQQGVMFGGFINALLDEDGILRSLPLLVSYKGKWFPGLSLAAVMRAQRIKTIHIEEDFFGPVIVAGHARFPVDKTGRALIGFTGKQETIPTISALDVLSGNVNRTMFGERIVFLGSSATGLQDVYQTPVGAGFPGVETHAVLAENSVTGTGFRVPVWWKQYILALMCFTGITVSLAFIFLPPGWASLAAVFLGLLGPAAGAWMLMYHGVLMPMAATIPAVLILSFLLSLLLYRKERQQVLRQIRKFVQGRQTTLEAMAAVAETRDAETGGHLKRVQEYIRILADYLAEHDIYPSLTEEYIEMLFQCAPLHDIGKVGIPDCILMKPASLTTEEFEAMKEHAAMGKTIIENSCKNEDDKEIFQLAAELAYTHHERWDGKGYPQGLAGEDIPLSGRLMSLVDVYDALISKRHYKKGLSHERARQIIVEKKGSQFDPKVVDAFLALEDKFVEISKKIVDKEVG